MNVILDDIGLNDLPIIEKIGADKLLERLRQSSLKEFSVRYPHIVKWKFNDNEILGGAANVRNTTTGVIYKIPKYVYDGTQIIGLARVDPVASTGFNDIYVPSIYSYDPVSVLTTVADVKLAASLGQQMSKAMTWEYIHPDKIKLYNGWLSGTYEASIMLLHDDSLSTIPPTAFTNFRQLATLDLKGFIYNKYKRIDNLDLGIGTINLKIDDWADSMNQFNELLKEWDESGNMDIDYIQYF